MNVNHQILVEFADVQKTYDGTELVIKNLNLKIHKGEFFNPSGPLRVRKDDLPNDVSRF